MLYNSKWKKIISEGKKWVQVSTRDQATYIRVVANRLGYKASRKLLPTGQFRVWIYKDGERVPERRGRFRGDFKNIAGGACRGNWDVDIYNLPIPQSAYRA